VLANTSTAALVAVYGPKNDTPRRWIEPPIEPITMIRPKSNQHQTYVNACIHKHINVRIQSCV
jgi:hypothetical protein